MATRSCAWPSGAEYHANAAAVGSLRIRALPGSRAALRSWSAARCRSLKLAGTVMTARSDWFARAPPRPVRLACRKTNALISGKAYASPRAIACVLLFGPSRSSNGNLSTTCCTSAALQGRPINRLRSRYRLPRVDEAAVDGRVSDHHGAGRMEGLTTDGEKPVATTEVRQRRDDSVADGLPRRCLSSLGRFRRHAGHGTDSYSLEKSGGSPVRSARQLALS